MAVRDVRDCSIRFSYPEYTEDGTGYLYVDPSNAIPCAVGPDIYIWSSHRLPHQPRKQSQSQLLHFFSPIPTKAFLHKRVLCLVRSIPVLAVNYLFEWCIVGVHKP